MIIDTTDAFSLIAAWDKWSGNEYRKIWYPSVSVSSASHMLGRSVSASNLTDEEGMKIDGALASVKVLAPEMFNVTVAYVIAEGSCLAVERMTGVSRKAVGILAKTGLELCGNEIRKALSEAQE